MLSEEQARQYYGDNDAAHGFEHVRRVAVLALRIAEAEGADRDVVRTAALLHDIGRAEQARTGACHAEIGARRAREILRDSTGVFREAVVHAIATHRYRDQSNLPETLEAKVLFDADKLDSIGAVGIGRAYAMAGQRGQRLWSPLTAPDVSDRSTTIAGCPEDHTPVQEYLFKLRHLKDGMLTDTGRSLAVDRHAYMESFFERLESEVCGAL